MRIRITRKPEGSIDGIQLARLDVGRVYEVSTSLASYLLCEQLAEPAGDDAPAIVLPLGEHRSFAVPSGEFRPARARAADKPNRR